MDRLFTYLRFKPTLVIDYGCSTGTSSFILLQTLTAQRIIALDISGVSPEVARQFHKLFQLPFMFRDEFETKPEADLVFCNGVLHHIQPKNRAIAVRDIFELLLPEGLFALWENNP